MLIREAGDSPSIQSVAGVYAAPTNRHAVRLTLVLKHLVISA